VVLVLIPLCLLHLQSCLIHQHFCYGNMSAVGRLLRIVARGISDSSACPVGLNGIAIGFMLSQFSFIYPRLTYTFSRVRPLRSVRPLQAPLRRVC